MRFSATATRYFRLSYRWRPSAAYRSRTPQQLDPMTSFRPRHVALAVAAACALFTFADQSAAVGRWNMPSNSAQYMGVGFGPGYHAPMVLGRCWKAKPASPGVDRVPAPLCAPSGLGYVGLTPNFGTTALPFASCSGNPQSNQPREAPTDPHLNVAPHRASENSLFAPPRLREPQPANSSEALPIPGT